MVEDQLKHDVHNDPYSEQVADGCNGASEQFSSMFSPEQQPEKVRRISRPGIVEASTDPQENSNDWLQDEA